MFKKIILSCILIFVIYDLISSGWKIDFEYTKNTFSFETYKVLIIGIVPNIIYHAIKFVITIVHKPIFVFLIFTYWLLYILKMFNLLPK